MKTSHALLLVAVVGIAAFLIGNRSTSAAGASTSSSSSTQNVRTSSLRRGSSDDSGAAVTIRIKPGRELAADKARFLTPEQRMELLKKAAFLSDPARQEDVLCGLVAVMTKEELEDTVRILREAMGRGNQWSQTVWNTVWLQWGKVDPMACLALSKEGATLFTNEDYRCLMSGWLEADPSAAVAWANQSGHDSRESVAAAYAITNAAGGDIKAMEAAIASLASDPATAKSCFHDLFDLAISSPDSKTPDTVYDGMTPALKAAAWPVVMERLTYSDPAQAAEWLENHAGDPGHDYNSTIRLVRTLAGQDPAGTMEWAMGFSLNNPTQGPRANPTALAFETWLNSDSAAAHAWVESLPPESPFFSRIGPLDPPDGNPLTR